MCYYIDIVCKYGVFKNTYYFKCTFNTIKRTSFSQGFQNQHLFCINDPDLYELHIVLAAFLVQ